MNVWTASSIALSLLSAYEMDYIRGVFYVSGRKHWWGMSTRRPCFAEVFPNDESRRVHLLVYIMRCLLLHSAVREHGGVSSTYFWRSASSLNIITVESFRWWC